jgi:hypothetical protein
MKDSDGLLAKMGDSMNELKDMISSGLSDVAASLKDALNAAIDAISNLELPDIIKDLFNALKKLDFGGVKDFLKDLLHVGASFLCNNLDFLKMFMLGFALNRNILGGLLTALLMSWLDRFCKGFSANEVEQASKTEKLEMLVPPTGMGMNASNAFSNFTNTYADYIRGTAPITLDTAFDTNTFINGVTSGDVTGSLANLRSSEISSTDRSSYLSAIDAQLPNYATNSPEYGNLLTGRGGLLSLPLISVERREASLNFSNLSDTLGGMSKNLVKVDLSSVNTFSFNELEKGLADKVKQYQTTVASNPDMTSRGYNSGSHDTFDFASALPTLTPEETTYLSGLEGSGTAHRLHDMHPTTSLFLEA